MSAKHKEKMPERPRWIPVAEWREYLWQVAGQPTPIRLATAKEYGCPVIPDKILA